MRKEEQKMKIKKAEDEQLNNNIEESRRKNS